MNPFLLALAVLPGLAISYAIFRVDKYDREPFAPLALCFAAGAALIAPAIWVEGLVFRAAGDPADYDLGEVLLLSFGALALNEELFKFTGLLVLAFPRRFFNEPLDGIVYAVLLAMGFATLENVLYADRFGLPTVLLRAFTAVPAHLAFAIVQGYFFGLAKFDPARRTRLLLRGLLLATLLHGAYDFLILQQWLDWLFVLATLALYLGLFFCGKLVREHLENSPFR